MYHYHIYDEDVKSRYVGENRRDPDDEYDEGDEYEYDQGNAEQVQGRTTAS
jgi:hypothetical protein